MPLSLILLIGLHLVAAVFWLFSCAVLGWGGQPGAARTMFRPQMIAAIVAMFTGGGLWQLLHAGGFGPHEMVLALGALLAIVTTGVQGAMVGGPVRRLKTGAGAEGELLARIVLGERIATGLLLVTFACMVGERFV